MIIIPTVSLTKIRSAVNRAEVCVTDGGLDATNGVSAVVPAKMVPPTAAS